MVENVGRKLTFVGLVLAIALGFLLIPDQPFRLGLDLQGGTRLTYRFDFDKALRDGAISQQDYDDRITLLSQTITIIRSRLDPHGVLEAILRPEGIDRVVIELPGAPDVGGVKASSTLASSVAENGLLPIVLDKESATGFPVGGGVVQIDEEKIRYERREGEKLFIEKRAYFGTDAAAHEAGAGVELSQDDAIRNIIENLGDLKFRIVANAADFDGTGTDLNAEQGRLRTWVAANPGTPVKTFNGVPRENGGPPVDVFRWFAAEQDAKLAQESYIEVQSGDVTVRALALLTPEEDQSFGGPELARVYPSQDSTGGPAVGFEITRSRQGDFGRFTGDHVKRLMAIVLNDEVSSAPVIEGKLVSGGVITGGLGGFSLQEMNELLMVLRSGSLRISPILEQTEVVGPTLGADYVKRGMYSGMIALGAVLLFMVVYYRRLGVYSAISLLLALLMLMGGLAFLQATLTLPGIAGIILTLGMAVDANILIFDRIREEADKGQNARQAAKTGFERAFSAIFDANITTLLTAIILYNVGTGPVRGFAVTLSIGIIASMIAALVITRLFVHFGLERGVKSFTVGTWLVKANYDFLSKAKLALGASAAVIIAGLALFIATPTQDKFGIDFLGGAEVHFRTEEPQAIDDVRARVAEIPGRIGESASVKPVVNSATGDGFTAFRAIFKVDEDLVGTSGDNPERALAGAIRDSLADILQRGPVELGEPRQDGANANWDITLYFSSEHPPADIEERLNAASLQSARATPTANRDMVYAVTGQTSVGMDAITLRTAIQNAFNNATDSNQVAFDLTGPIAGSSLVGPQVVGELRDKAVLALLVSLFAIVLYIRVRFAEYSYGFAAVVALLHDVFITLGAMTLMNNLGLIAGEINLPMIAAFLTIIGYSLNDTIVIFDRVRENLPRLKKPLAEVLNISINQTLSRTLLTSLTTLMAVSVLFVFNVGTGNTLEGFSFAMIIGVLTGTYSTIFVANPTFLWLENRAARKREAAKRSEAKAVTS
ncbi:MAG: protein translocase subunit SecD [Planctomycetota bacterium]|nr:protein translocase subunit SecD [Planctomycetota bacterium]